MCFPPPERNLDGSRYSSSTMKVMITLPALNGFIVAVYSSPPISFSHLFSLLPVAKPEAVSFATYASNFS